MTELVLRGRVDIGMLFVVRAGFRVAVEGYDSAGHILRRYDTTSVSVVVVKLDVRVVGNNSYSLKPGESVNVTVNVTNFGVPTTWYIRVTDTANFFTGASQIPYVHV